MSVLAWAAGARVDVVRGMVTTTDVVVIVYNVHRAKHIIPCSDKKRSVKCMA